MRRWFRVLLALTGLILAAVGAGVAGYVGSDDTVFTTPQTVGTNGEPVLTTPGLLAYDRIQVTLRAQAEGGVFIGAGHPVDVEDYLGKTTHLRLTGVSARGVTVEERAGDTVVADAEGAGFWTGSRQGEGPQELALSGADAGEWVIVPGQGSTQLSIGVTVPGIYLTALVVTALGLVLLVVGVELLLRAKPQPPDQGAVAKKPVAKKPGQRKGTRKKRADRGSRVRRGLPVALPAALPVALIAISLSLTGCQLSGTLVGRPVNTEVPPKVALTKSELSAVVASLDRRISAATKKAGAPTYNPARWRKVDEGGQLAGDQFATRYAKVARLRKVRAPQHTGLRVYSPTFTSYPLWAIAVTESAASSGRQVTLLTKGSVTSDWMRQASVPVRAEDLPKSSTPEPPAKGASVAVVTKATAAWAAYVQSSSQRGSQGGSGRQALEVDKATQKWRQGLDDLASHKVFSAMQVAAEPTDDAPRVLHVEGGVLALTNIKVVARLIGKKDLKVQWRQPLDRLRPGPPGRLSIHYLATAVVFIPDSKESGTHKPRLLGATYREVSPPKAPAKDKQQKKKRGSGS